MKLRTATPASAKSFVKRALLVVVVLLVAVVTPIQISQSVSADPYDDKIRVLQEDINKYQAEANRLNGEAVTLQSTLAQLANEKAAIQAQINLNQAKYDQLVIDIANTEKKIKDNQDALGETIADLYVDTKISPLEMLASSNNISDYLDKQEYRNSVRDELTSTITEIKDLKEKLSTQKTDVEKILAEQKSSRDTLAAKENEQQGILNTTQNNEAAYQNLISNSAAQIAAARATQAALNARVNQGGGMTLVEAGSLGAYPWNSSNCYVDVNAISHGGANPPNVGGDRAQNPFYGCRQCTSYVAWKIAEQTGRYYWNWGNGGDFASSAINNGYQNLGRSPQPGSVAVMWGNPGHVAWVEDVLDGGANVLVSQYNYNYGSGWGMYSKVIWPTSTFDQYVKIN